MTVLEVVERTVIDKGKSVFIFKSLYMTESRKSMPRVKMTQVNAEYIRAYFIENDYSQETVSISIGKAKTYVNCCLAKGDMEDVALRFVCSLTGMDYGKATSKPKKKDNDVFESLKADPHVPIKFAVEKAAGSIEESITVVDSDIQDLGKIQTDILRNIRDTRSQIVEELKNLNKSMAELMSLLRSMGSENRTFHVNTNNKLVEMNNRMTSGR